MRRCDREDKKYSMKNSISVFGKVFSKRKTTSKNIDINLLKTIHYMLKLITTELWRWKDQKRKTSSTQQFAKSSAVNSLTKVQKGTPESKSTRKYLQARRNMKWTYEKYSKTKQTRKKKSLTTIRRRNNKRKIRWNLM